MCIYICLFVCIDLSSTFLTMPSRLEKLIDTEAKTYDTKGPDTAMSEQDRKHQKAYSQAYLCVYIYTLYMYMYICIYSCAILNKHLGNITHQDQDTLEAKHLGTCKNESRDSYKGIHINLLQMYTNMSINKLIQATHSKSCMMPPRSSCSAATYSSSESESRNTRARPRSQSSSSEDSDQQPRSRSSPP